MPTNRFWQSYQPTNWRTFPIEVRGGLITQGSPLQQGLNSPGSARQLKNFEPSVTGGYRRILGYTKYEANPLPLYGEPVVQGSGQSGATLVIGNVLETPQVSDTITIAGVTGSYTVATSGVAYNSLNKEATLTLTTSLTSSPADKALVTFGNRVDLVKGIKLFNGGVVAYRSGGLYFSTGTGWTKISKQNYGSTLVNGVGQTGTTVAIDGLTVAPAIGSTFTVAGIEKSYTVLTLPTVTAGGATVSIYPALASSPADNAVVTFNSLDRAGAGKHRAVMYDFSGTPKIIFVDEVHNPVTYDGTDLVELDGVPTDVAAAEHVSVFSNHMFFSKGTILSFTAPYTDNDFTAANGAGSIRLPHAIMAIVLFREQLIVFCKERIFRVTGSSSADFTLKAITDDIGCTETDTIQEVGGDVMFLAPDGLRLLSATTRIGDFGLAVASRNIQTVMTDFVATQESFSSAVIREKNQFRLFGYRDGLSDKSSRGILGTQFADQSAKGMAWSELTGINVYVVDSKYTIVGEEIVFANKDGYAYKMEDSSTFDGTNIQASFFTPYYAMKDPKVRKTIYKLSTYVDPTGSVSGEVALKLDYNQAGVIQPSSSAITIGADAGTAAYYGAATYGTAVYGGKPVAVFTNQTSGSGFSVSVQYSFNGVNTPFSIDAIILDYATYDRQ